MRLKNWKRIPAALAALSAAAVVSTRAADAVKPAAVVMYAQGTVQIKRASAGAYVPAVPKDLLYAGDELNTGAGQAVLATRGAEIRLDANSVLAVEPGGRAREIVSLKTGRLWTKLLKASAKLDVRTSAATCIIRGTEAVIEQRALLTVKVYEGKLEVRNGKGAQPLEAGQMTTVAAGSAPAPAKRMTISDKDDWQESLKVKDRKPFLDALTASEGDTGAPHISAR